MGAHLCSFKHPSTDDEQDRQNDGGNNNNNNNPSQSCSLILELIRRPGTCLQKRDDIDDVQRAKKRSSNALLMYHPPSDRQMIKRSSKVRKLTLEEWILNSPGAGLTVKRPPQDFLHSGGELHACRHSSRKVHPSNSASSSSSYKQCDHRKNNLATKAIDSFCLEPMVKASSRDGPSGNDSTISRSRGGKLTKKVRFKEEPDIVIIYSPEELFSDDIPRQDSAPCFS